MALPAILRSLRKHRLCTQAPVGSGERRDCWSAPCAIGHIHHIDGWDEGVAACKVAMLSRQNILLLLLTIACAKLSRGNLLHTRVTHPSVITTTQPRGDHRGSSTSIHAVALARRTNIGVPMINCKQVWRHQQYAVIPTAVGAATLHAFWETLQWRSIDDVFFDSAKPIFTITQGALQATFSCLGQAVPRDFVHDFAMNAAESVLQGWLETFDAVYEQEATGIMMWVSLRVVQRLDAKRKRPD